MPKELPGYRDQLESIIAAFPDKECLNVLEVSAYTGIGLHRHRPKNRCPHFPFCGHWPRSIYHPYIPCSHTG